MTRMCRGVRKERSDETIKTSTLVQGSAPFDGLIQRLGWSLLGRGIEKVMECLCVRS